MTEKAVFHLTAPAGEASEEHAGTYPIWLRATLTRSPRSVTRKLFVWSWTSQPNFPSSEVKTVDHPGHATQSREPVQCDNQIHDQTFLYSFACLYTCAGSHACTEMCKVMCMYVCVDSRTDIFFNCSPPLWDTGCLTESGVYWFVRLNDSEAQIFLCQPPQCWDSI